MNIKTLENLRELRSIYGHGPFGKIAQKFLALSFGEIGFIHIVERSVEGVDIDISDNANRKYAIEVKTTVGKSVHLDQSNIQALKKRVKDGYKPLIAGLRLDIFEEWRLSEIPVNELVAGDILIDNLRVYRVLDLERSINIAFETIVSHHFAGTMKGGQKYLTQILEETGIEVIPD